MNEPSDVPDPSATILYVGNLDRRVTDTMMVNILRKGLPHLNDRVISAKMFGPDDISQGAEGYCFVHFQDNNAACQSMTFLNGRDFCGKKVQVNWATNSTNGGMPKVIGSSVTIFVGDLDDDITDGELRQAFDPFGEILNAKVVRDAASNKSKNYGFISFNNKPDAERAIREMHGAMLKRRPIKTNWATRNQNSKPSTLEYDQVYKETESDNCTVYVTNLPDRITEDMLLKHFEPYGKIVGNARLFEGKNFAFIRFESHAAAATAIVKSNGSELNGAILKCWWGKEDTHGSTQLPGSIRSYNNQSNTHSSSPTSPDDMLQQQQQEQQQQQQQMTPQQYMQYIQQYSPQYQQQYYQYWMQQYQLMQQGGQQPGAQQQAGYPYQYGQQQQQGWQGQQQPSQQQQQQQSQQSYQGHPQNYQN